MDINIPFIAKSVGALGAAGAGGIILTSQTTSSAENKDLTKIQITFYDSTDNNSQEKTIRMPLSLPFKFSSVEIPKTSNNNQWENLESSTTEYGENKKKNMWKTLFEIGSKYVQVQHQLNIIRSGRGTVDIASDPLKTQCKNKDCCCKEQGASQCNCEKGTCCALCLCCYVQDSTKTECCCKNSQENCYDDLIKSQNTFSYLRPNIDSYWTGKYLQPLKAHIKLDVKFTDLEQENSTDSSQTETKPFFGTLTYGFVDYWSKSAKYSSLIPSKDTSKYSTLESGKEYWFTNVPHKFTFTYKKSSSSGSSSTNGNNYDDIEKVWKEVETAQKIKKFEGNTSQSPSLCCTDKSSTDEVIKCLLARNYVYLEKTSIDGIKDKLKDLKTCCTSTSSS